MTVGGPTENSGTFGAPAEKWGMSSFLSLYEAVSAKLDNATLYRRCHEMGDLAVAAVKAKLLQKPPARIS